MKTWVKDKIEQEFDHAVYEIGQEITTTSVTRKVEQVVAQNTLLENDQYGDLVEVAKVRGFFRGLTFVVTEVSTTEVKRPYDTLLG